MDFSFRFDKAFDKQYNNMFFFDKFCFAFDRSVNKNEKIRFDKFKSLIKGK